MNLHQKSLKKIHHDSLWCNIIHGHNQYIILESILSGKTLDVIKEGAKIIELHL